MLFCIKVLTVTISVLTTIDQVVMFKVMFLISGDTAILLIFTIQGDIVIHLLKEMKESKSHREEKFSLVLFAIDPIILQGNVFIEKKFNLEIFLLKLFKDSLEVPREMDILTVVIVILTVVVTLTLRKTNKVKRNKASLV